MNNQKPNTPAQRDVDGILRQEAANKAQKQIDALVSEMGKGQSHSGESKPDINRGESKDAKAAYDAKLAKDLKEDAEKFKVQSNIAQAQAAKAQHNDANPNATLAPEAENQGESNDYFNSNGIGM